jgi:hypothetical protein
MRYLYVTMGNCIRFGRKASMRDDNMASLRSFIDAVPLSNGSIRVGYVVSVDLSPVAWGSFIDARKADTSADAQLIAADAAYTSLLSVHKLLSDTNTIENLFPNTANNEMVLLSHDSEFVRVCLGAYTSFSSKKSLNALGQRIFNDVASRRLAVGMTRPEWNCGSLFCRAVDISIVYYTSQRAMTGEVQCVAPDEE